MKIVKLLILMLIASILTIENSYAQQGCDEVFKAVYQTLNVNSEDSYLETLYEIYSSTSQSQVDSRTAQAGGISVPGYGTGDWKSNKSKITSIYNSEDWRRTHSLSEQNKLTLTKLYYEPKVAIRAIEAWEKCIIPRGLPSISHEGDDSIITIKLKMNSDYRKTNEKVKVRLISSSSNLRIDTSASSFKAGDSLVYNGTYNLSFLRLDKGKSPAYVAIALSEGDLPTERIYPIVEPPVSQREVRQVTETYNVSFNIPRNWMKVQIPNRPLQTLTYPNNTGFYDIDFNKHGNKGIETNLDYKKVSNVKWYFTHDDGRVAKVVMEDHIIRNGRIVFDGFLSVKDITKGRLIVTYETETEVCINCD